MGIMDNLKSKIKEVATIAKETLSDACCDEEKKLGGK